MKPALQTIFPKPILLVLAGFIVLLVIELTAILILNNGHFVFTLDDPYIHLALAENIWHGHYGVNLQEYSAPSSSILWPIRIAPLTALPYTSWMVLLLNTTFAMLTLLVASRVIETIQPEQGRPLSAKAQVFLLAVFMLAVNLTGLTLIGMEHNQQVLLAVIIAWGLIHNVQTGTTSPWLIIAIILSPLVRYENAIISAVALLFLFLQKDWIKSLVSGLAIVVCLAAFSFFLLSLGLNYLPDSVLAKSDIAASGLQKLFNNFSRNFAFPNTLKSMALLLMAVYFCATSSMKMLPANKRLLSAITALALLLHLLGGRVGWYFRYEMSLWAFALIIFITIYTSLPQKRVAKILAGICMLVALLESIVVLGSSPLASSNIYHQQYQMHRFITGIYKKPVAVNDLGWASYQNNNYVLDLWGLGSSEARQLRKSSKDVQWMDDLVAEKNIELIMIYNNTTWFAQVPTNWIKVAELDVTGPKITAWYPVSFFVRDSASALTVKTQLKEFKETLPQGSELAVDDNN
jgi:hypothetical protein